MQHILYKWVLLLVVAVVMLNQGGCEQNDNENGNGNKNESPEIAVTNTYLQAMVTDLSQGKKEVMCLTPPGMCPGHFDISPGMVNRLRRCRVLLRADFQQSLDKQLKRVKQDGLSIQSIQALPGFCLPQSYLSSCDEVMKVLVELDPDRQADYRQQSERIKNRLNRLTSQLKDKIRQASIEKAKVITSTHQAEFVRWLGLKVVGTFAGRDSATPGSINACIEKAHSHKIKFVIANLQGGTELARALAERLNAKIVIFSNFPDKADQPDSFDQLLKNNVAALLEH
ncbi:MAG: zinc ABC transporter substrate-binding protein [Sedimentisphaerales bacterium]|nr:zinc ABC transporter substrate-binding protein [Sedimentisphaerales bacterium]